MRLVELTTKDSIAYKQFFSQGLSENADSFRLSATDELQEPFPTRDTPDSFTLAVVPDDEETLMGVVSFKRETDNRSKLRHKGLLFRMYVSDQYSGKGIARLLMNELIDRVKRLPDIEQINLTVVSSNERAKALYRKIGFVPFSLEKNAIKTDKGYFDEESMVLPL